jgi:acyl-CoA thioesterase FadM
MTAATAPLRSFTWRIRTGDADLPDDRYTFHVNNARYAYFINCCCRDWYVAMGLRDPAGTHSVMMVRSEYDFVAEMKPPHWAECRIEVVRVGRSSIEHMVEMRDVGVTGSDELRVVGRGRVTHVHIDRATRKSVPWTPATLAKCWE